MCKGTAWGFSASDSKVPLALSLAENPEREFSAILVHYIELWRVHGHHHSQWGQKTARPSLLSQHYTTVRPAQMSMDE